MPNEKIHRTVTGTEVPADGISNTMTLREFTTRECLTVSWLPLGDVQVGVELTPDVFGVPEHSAWMSLNRYEINRLIKALRRARDAAYGRDE